MEVETGEKAALTPREQLIQRILLISNQEILAIMNFIDQLEDAEDLAMVEARKGETGISLDEYLEKNGLSRKELEAEARAEGLMR